MSKVQKMTMGGWVFYVGENYLSLEKNKSGKWMYFFDDISFADEICENAVLNDVCVESKHSDEAKGVCCFYLNGDDIDSHKKVIEYFIKNNLIKKTKAGKLYNISFKFDSQTRAGEYGGDFVAEIKLDQFVDLQTGEFIK